MTPKEFKQLLNKKTRTELIDEIEKLYHRFEDVQEYYSLNHATKKTDRKTVINIYQKNIDKALWPDDYMSGGLDVDEVDRLVKKFTATNANIEEQVDFELYVLERANQCAFDLGGDYGDEYYIYFEELFEETIKKIFNAGLFEQKRLDIKNIIDGAFEGYGHKDTLEETFDIYA